MAIDVKQLQASFPPPVYQLRLSEIVPLMEYAARDVPGALFAAYNYGFQRGKREEKNTRKRQRTGSKSRQAMNRQEVSN